MNDNTELELTRTDPNKITLSLQGHLFVLPANHVLCHDWLVKTIVETDVGKDAIRDAIYLDCEPDSFLLIYKILNNLYDIDNLSKLSEIALQLLVSSCKYMNCNFVATIIEEQIDTKHSEAEAARKEKASLLQQLELLGRRKHLSYNIWMREIYPSSMRSGCPSTNASAKTTALVKLLQLQLDPGVCAKTRR